MSTWKEPTDEELFDARCPWCRSVAARKQRLNTYACACGAVALGSPVFEFEKLVATAVQHFDLDVSGDAMRAHNPTSWLDAFGIDFREGGRVGDVDYYYWFHRVR